MEDVLEVHWEARQKSVVAPVVSEVSDGNCPNRERFRQRQPRNLGFRCRTVLHRPGSSLWKQINKHTANQFIFVRITTAYFCTIVGIVLCHIIYTANGALVDLINFC